MMVMMTPKRLLLPLLTTVCVLCGNMIRLSIMDRTVTLIGRDWNFKTNDTKNNDMTSKQEGMKSSGWVDHEISVSSAELKSDRRGNVIPAAAAALSADRSVLDIPIHHYQSSTSPVQDLLRVYVYDTLPPHLSTELEQFVVEQAYQSNFATDIALIRLFQTFPGRTYDPYQADILVVPYSHLAHCRSTPGYQMHCGNLPIPNATAVLQHLPYYNQETANRHLFLVSDGEWQAHRWILRQHRLVATYGPKWMYDGHHRNNDNIQQKNKKKIKVSSPGHILIPPMNTLPQFQPSAVLQKLLPEPLQQSNTTTTTVTTTKQYSLVFVGGAVNRVMGKKSPRKYRQYFLRELQNRSTVGGMPFVASSDIPQGNHNNYAATARNLPSNSEARVTTTNTLYQDLYPNSILCPILPGEMPWQRLFFDVMACGCLPMVISYPLLQQKQGEENNNRTSWFLPNPLPSLQHFHTWSIEESYPFVDAIDYRSFVVECPGNATHPQDMSHIPKCLDDWLLLLPENSKILQQKQEALQRDVVKVLYGVGPDAHRYEDAFAQLIRQIQRYLEGHIESSKEKTGQSSATTKPKRDDKAQYSLSSLLSVTHLKLQCQAVITTQAFQQTCQDSFFAQNSCQKLSDASLKIKDRWQAALTSPSTIQENTTVVSCKTLWITGMSMGFEVSAKKHQMADGGDGYRVQYATALQSAQEHATHLLQPVVILLTPQKHKMSAPSNESVQKYTEWLEGQGVIVLTIHRLSFQDMIYQAYPEYANGAIAYYLRFDIPKILRDPVHRAKLLSSVNVVCVDDVIFYTDSDILFVNDLPVKEFESMKRQVTQEYFLMYGQDYLLHRPKPSNTGIMLMHLEGFEEAWEDRIKPWGQRLLDQHWDAVINNRTQTAAAISPDWWFPPHDQLWLNFYYDKPKKWGVENRLLPPTWNWKVYWQMEIDNADDVSNTVRIVHFHGPKPHDGVNEAAVCDLESIQVNGTASKFPSAYQMLVASSICCDHGRTSQWLLALYEQWKPALEVVQQWE
jgi:Exostosin family